MSNRTEDGIQTFRLYHSVVLAMCMFHGFVIAGQKHPSDPYGPFPQGPFSSRCGYSGNILQYL